MVIGTRFPRKIFYSDLPQAPAIWFTKIDDHINYLMIRMDPDKVTPLKNEAQSKEYLSKPAPR